MLDKTFRYGKYKNYREFLLDKEQIQIENLNPHYWYKYQQDNLTDVYDPSFQKSFFRGHRVILPNFKELSFTNYKIESDFEKYTAKNEVRNIALWTLGCLDSFDHMGGISLGKEVEILQDSNPRDGRLDVCVKTKNKVLVIETKTTLRKMLDESRFDIQMINYQCEIDKLSYKNNINSLLLLEIGGKETDLYPLSHDDCLTNDVGLITTNFYSSIISKGIKFTSPNALWGLQLLNSGWDQILFDIFKRKDVLGLLSAGIVVSSKNDIIVEPLF